MTRRIVVPASLLAGFVAASALFAASPPLPTATELYCSGIVSRSAPRSVGRVVSGEEALDKLQFFQGDTIYLQFKNPSQIKTGDQFLVIREASDPTHIAWFRGEGRLERRMGRLWEDVGRVGIIQSGERITIARIESSCLPMQRGDILVTFEPRPAPPLPTSQPKAIRLAVSGRATGRVVFSKGFRQVLGSGYIAYVNLGTQQGAKVGDRMLLFRYSCSGNTQTYQGRGMAGGFGDFGYTPARLYRNLPREILGEAVILRVSATASTVLITASRREIDLGDLAELE